MVLFRYEDIVGENGERVLESILDFAFPDGKSDPQVQAMYDRIPCTHFTSVGKNRVGGYKPRHKDGDNPFIMYPPAKMKEVLDKSLENLCALGYYEWLSTVGRTFGYTCPPTTS